MSLVEHWGTACKRKERKSTSYTQRRAAEIAQQQGKGYTLYCATPLQLAITAFLNILKGGKGSITREDGGTNKGDENTQSAAREGHFFLSQFLHLPIWQLYETIFFRPRQCSGESRDSVESCRPISTEFKFCHHLS